MKRKPAIELVTSADGGMSSDTAKPGGIAVSVVMSKASSWRAVSQ